MARSSRGSASRARTSSRRPRRCGRASSAALNDALLTLDHGWTVHFETTRLPSSVSRGGDFLDPTCRLIDEERRKTPFFETEQWLFLTQAPPWSEQSPTLRNLKSWLYEEPRRSYEEELRTQLDRFDRTAERFANSLCAHLQISRFRSEPGNDELLQALYHCLTGRWQRTRLPEAPVCLDVLLAEDWLQGDPLTLGKRLVRAITLRGYPSDTFPGVLSALRALPFEVRWSQRFIVKDYQQSEALLKKEQRRWQQRTRSFASQVLRTAGRLDQHALERANELDAALGDLNAGAVLYGHHTSVLLISGESTEEIEARSALVERSVQTAGYIAHVETYNGLEAFIGSLPGHTRQNVRKPVIHSLNVADLLAISREWEGEPHCPSPFFSKRSPALAEVRSSSGARFFLNLHVGDVGHTLMLGPTGAGKSTLLAFLASQFLQYALSGRPGLRLRQRPVALPALRGRPRRRPRRLRGAGAGALPARGRAESQGTRLGRRVDRAAPPLTGRANRRRGAPSPPRSARNVRSFVPRGSPQRLRDDAPRRQHADGALLLHGVRAQEARSSMGPGPAFPIRRLPSSRSKTS